MGHTIRASFLYSVEAEFASMPPDDSRLEQWIKAQPGIVSATAQRDEANPRLLRIYVGIVQNMFHEPPLPDINLACRELGYRGQAAPFDDIAHRR